MAELALIRESTPGRPVFGTAVSHALLIRVARGEIGPTFRLHQAQPVLSFGKQDALASGFSRAVALAREGGFTPVLRLAGGRAAVFHEGTLAFAHAIPHSQPRLDTHARFDQMGEVLCDAFAEVGVTDPRMGEVPGEYCPGASSVNAGGRIKLAGVGQRLIAGGAHVGGVVVASDTESLRSVLISVYEALGLEWDPATAGSVEDEVPGATTDTVADAIVAQLAKRYDISGGTLDDETLALASELEQKHAIEL